MRLSERRVQLDLFVKGSVRSYSFDEPRLFACALGVVPSSPEQTDGDLSTRRTGHAEARNIRPSGRDSNLHGAASAGFFREPAEFIDDEVMVDCGTASRIVIKCVSRLRSGDDRTVRRNHLKSPL